MIFTVCLLIYTVCSMIYTGMLNDLYSILNDLYSILNEYQNEKNIFEKSLLQTLQMNFQDNETICLKFAITASLQGQSSKHPVLFMLAKKL